MHATGQSRDIVAGPMSVTAFFDYLHEHNASTDLAKALGETVMLRTCGARRDTVPARAERLAS